MRHVYNDRATDMRGLNTWAYLIVRRNQKLLRKLRKKIDGNEGNGSQTSWKNSDMTVPLVRSWNRARNELGQVYLNTVVRDSTIHRLTWMDVQGAGQLAPHPHPRRNLCISEFPSFQFF